MISENIEKAKIGNKKDNTFILIEYEDSPTVDTLIYFPSIDIKYNLDTSVLDSRNMSIAKEKRKILSIRDLQHLIFNLERMIGSLNQCISRNPAKTRICKIPPIFINDGQFIGLSYVFEVRDKKQLFESSRFRYFEFLKPEEVDSCLSILKNRLDCSLIWLDRAKKLEIAKYVVDSNKVIVIDRFNSSVKMLNIDTELSSYNYNVFSEKLMNNKDEIFTLLNENLMRGIIKSTLANIDFLLVNKTKIIRKLVKHNCNSYELLEKIKKGRRGHYVKIDVHSEIDHLKKLIINLTNYLQLYEI